MFELSKDQEAAFNAYCEWRKSGKRLFTLAGSAGTGKSFLISYIKEKFPMTRIAFCAYAGKAALVLKNKLEGKIRMNDYVGTIHGLIYHPVIDKKTKKILGWRKQKFLDYDLIIVDEASMVDGEIFNDLKSYRIPILAVGDHHQLPPVNGTFSLMETPDIKLETPHRFAESLPLIKIATLARETGNVPFGEYGEGVEKIGYHQFMRNDFEKYIQSQDFIGGNSVIICGFNKTRVALNERIRNILGRSGEPKQNDRVICLKNNKKNYPQIFNGLCGNIEKIESSKDNKKAFNATIKLDGQEDRFIGDIDIDTFGNSAPDLFKKKDIDFFDFGYVISCHKAIGSQWENVLVIEQNSDLWDKARWNYTAFTRSTKNLIILK